MSIQKMLINEKKVIILQFCEIVYNATY